MAYWPKKTNTQKSRIPGFLNLWSWVYKPIGFGPYQYIAITSHIVHVTALCIRDLPISRSLITLIESWALIYTLDPTIQAQSHVGPLLYRMSQYRCYNETRVFPLVISTTNPLTSQFSNLWYPTSCITSAGFVPLLLWSSITPITDSITYHSAQGRYLVQPTSDLIYRRSVIVGPSSLTLSPSLGVFGCNFFNEPFRPFSWIIRICLIFKGARQPSFHDNFIIQSPFWSIQVAVDS